MEQRQCTTLILQLPVLSDQAAAELLDMLQQLFVRLDTHYWAQAARYRHRQHEEEELLPPTPMPYDQGDPF
jgi:hypothetical protein